MYSRRHFFTHTAAALLAASAFPQVKLHAEDTDEVVSELPGRWTAERANAWYACFPWLCGFNYVPTYAVNQIEMWQKSTFRPEIIDSELELAASIGMNTVRIFAHDLVWRTEGKGFFDRVKIFLELCEKHNINVCYTFFTNGGKEPAVMGPQPFTPGVHNAEWRQSPGLSVVNAPERWDSLKEYVQKTIQTFADDSRILMWNLFNEPANNSGAKDVAGFTRRVFQWAREVNPSQPLSSDHQQKKSPVIEFMNRNCDVISFHEYGGPETLRRYITELQKSGRPVLCTEWMARHLHSTVPECLPIFRQMNVGCYCWGLIPGKLQTNIPWPGLVKKFPDKKDLWFHDLFHADHTPYDPKETEIIRKMTQLK